MGIPRLKKHLLSFCQPVLFQGGTDCNDEGLECISSLVIDGPSLVYSVYSRLLSWFSATGPSRFEALPTCDEVSQGVMLYLAHLEMLGVKMYSQTLWILNTSELTLSARTYISMEPCLRGNMQPALPDLKTKEENSKYFVPKPRTASSRLYPPGINEPLSQKVFCAADQHLLCTVTFLLILLWFRLCSKT